MIEMEKMYKEQKELDTYLMKSERDIEDFLVHSWNTLYFVVSVTVVTPYEFSFDRPMVCGILYFICIPSIYFQNYSSGLVLFCSLN